MELLARWYQKLADIVFVLQYYNVVRYVVSFVISVIMVRSALPPSDLGNYELFLFVVASISMFWSGGIKNAMFTWYGKLSAKEQSNFPIVAFGFLSILSIFFALVVWLFSDWLMAVFGATELVSYWFYLCIYLVLSGPLVMTETLLFLRKDTQKLLNYTHWSHGGLLILTLVLAVYSAELWYFIYLLIFWTAIRLVYLSYLIFKNGNIKFTTTDLMPFAVFSLPLIFNMLLGSAMDVIDGMFVSHFFDASFFPVFRYGARELPLSGLLFSTLSMAMIPTIMQEGAGTLAVRARASKLMHYLFPLSFALMLVSPYVFTLFYGDGYQSSAFIFNIYLLIISSRVLLAQSFTLAFHHHRIVIWSSIIEIVFNIALSFWWMKLYGVYGLAFATVVSYFVQKLILIGYNYKKYGIKLNQYIDVRSYLAYMTLLLMTFVFSTKFLT